MDASCTYALCCTEKYMPPWFLLFLTLLCTCVHVPARPHLCACKTPLVPTQTGEPPFPKPVYGELGCCTPYIIVPGEWSESDMEYQAEMILTGAYVIEQVDLLNSMTGVVKQ